jgi:hypothetical protein
VDVTVVVLSGRVAARVHQEAAGWPLLRSAGATIIQPGRLRPDSVVDLNLRVGDGAELDLATELTVICHAISSRRSSQPFAAVRRSSDPGPLNETGDVVGPATTGRREVDGRRGEYGVGRKGQASATRRGRCGCPFSLRMNAAASCIASPSSSACCSVISKVSPTVIRGKLALTRISTFDSSRKSLIWLRRPELQACGGSGICC